MLRASLTAAALFVGAGVLGAALSQYPGWTLPAAVVAVILAAGAALLYYAPLRRRFRWAWTLDDRRHHLGVTLAGFISAGNDLMARVAPLGLETDKLAAIEQEAGRWGGAVKDFLDREAPGKSALFLDESYGPTQFVSQYGDRDRIANWLERRLSKLSEIVQSLA